MNPNLFTPIYFSKPKHKIDHSSKVLFLGSCFADNIGNKFHQLKFPVIHNPFGVIYNPFSLANSLEILMNQIVFEETDLGYYNELWYSFYHHSSFSSPDKNDCLEKINRNMQESIKFLREVDYIFLTFGTAWIYKHIETKQVVNNCHKIPSNQFERIFLNPNQIANRFEEIIKQLKSIRENISIVFTISPIRHLKDGAIENQRSKASLILAVKEIESCFENVSYFPAYEIFMDELRDYRFYDSDMAHPSPQGIDYIWNTFSDTYFDENTKNLIKRINALIQGINHRPRFPKTKAYKLFVENLKTKAEQIKSEYPGINFTNEINQLLSN